MKIRLLSYHISFCCCEETPKQYWPCGKQSPPGKSELHLSEQCRSLGEDWVMIWAWYGKSGIRLAVPASAYRTERSCTHHSSNKEEARCVPVVWWLPYDPVRRFHVVIRGYPNRRTWWRNSGLCDFSGQPVFRDCGVSLERLWMKSWDCGSRISLIQMSTLTWTVLLCDVAWSGFYLLDPVEHGLARALSDCFMYGCQQIKAA